MLPTSPYGGLRLPRRQITVATGIPLFLKNRGYLWAGIRSDLHYFFVIANRPKLRGILLGGTRARVPEVRIGDCPTTCKLGFKAARGSALKSSIGCLKQLKQNMLTKTKIGTTSASTAAWTSIGPQPIDTSYGASVVSGRVTAFAIDPSNPGIVYLGVAQGGVWKTTNGGTNWNGHTCSRRHWIDYLGPNHSSTVYVGTGEENDSGDSYYGAGIVKSTGGGTTLTQICGPFCGPVGRDGFYGGGARIGALAVDRAPTRFC